MRSEEQIQASLATNGSHSQRVEQVAEHVHHATDHPLHEHSMGTLVDTIIISDLHLGAKVSRARHALALLKRHTYRRLILNGDVFDDLNFKRLKADDWKFLSYVRKMSNPKTGVEVIWVIGNHDGGVADVLSHLLGVPVHEEYVFEVAGRIHVAIHGHQFDMWVKNRVAVTAVATALYTVLQVVDRRHRVSRWVKRTSKRILRMGDKIGHAATRHAKQHHNADVVHCGHTHIATEAEINGVRYVNSGSWTDAPSQYVTVEQDGTVILHHSS